MGSAPVSSARCASPFVQGNALASAAEASNACTPAACGAAIDVPDITDERENGGTVDHAVPGASPSGLSSSPPRLENANTLRPFGLPPNNVRACPSVRSAADVHASVAAPGVPRLDRPGPSLPPETFTASHGFAASSSSRSLSMSEWPSRSLPTP